MDNFDVVKSANTFIGEMIKCARKSKGLTQEQLAQQVNVSTMSIRRYENGTRIIPDDVKKRISEVLGDVVGDEWAEDFKKWLGRDFSSWKSNAVSYLAQQRISLDAEEAELQTLAEQVRNTLDVQSFVDSLDGVQIMMLFSSLNEEGREKAVERMEELTQIPKYQRTPSTEATETPLQAFADDRQGETSTKQEKPSEG